MQTYGTYEIDLYANQHRCSISPLRHQKAFPTVLTVAGSDSSGGAGIEADIKTITAHKCYALTCIVCLTAQNTLGVASTGDTRKDLIDAILDENFSDISIDVIKTGLMTKDACISLKNAIEKYNFQGFVVFDPVMVSTSGFNFVTEGLLDQMAANISRYISIITPNLMEAKSLVKNAGYTLDSNENDVESLEDIFEMCWKIHKATKIQYILIKGGHQNWKDKTMLTDVMYDSKTNAYYVFKSKKLNSTSTHGTGCTLASAIAANLANGFTMLNAVANGILYVQNSIKIAPGLGKGNGPLNHMSDVYSYDFDIVPFRISSEPNPQPFDIVVGSEQMKQLWSNYINHKFFHSIGNLKLDINKFREFCGQNVKYLRAYAQVLALMITKTNDLKEIEACSSNISATLHLVENYKRVMIKLGSSLQEIDSIKLSKEMNNSVEYMLCLASGKTDYCDLFVSLLPCSTGYILAALAVEMIVSIESENNDLRSSVYIGWLTELRSSGTVAYLEREKSAFNKLFEKYCITETKYRRMLSIFEGSVKMEIALLDYFV